MDNHTLHCQLTTPAHDDRPVYITGNFCGWAIDQDSLRLQPARAGCYTIDLSVDETWPDPIEYKYYRGGQTNTELNQLGELTDNRAIARATTHLRDHVPYWQWEGQSVNPAFLPEQQTFYLDYPGGEVPRRVRVLLPYDYEISGKSYPVLYLKDGQNLLGEGEGFGSWRAEMGMAQLASRGQHGVILVAIDHGGPGRMAEYTVEAARKGLGEGRTYLNRVVTTLKPMIDACFRTLPDAANTGMGGSSLGGLISLWAGLLYPDVFGKWLIFSPALWISPGVYRAAAERKLLEHAKVYLYGGELESKYMVPNLNRLQTNLRRNTDADAYLRQATDPTGLHQEGRWSVELPRAIQWLFFPDANPTGEAHEANKEMIING